MTRLTVHGCHGRGRELPVPASAALEERRRRDRDRQRRTRERRRVRRQGGAVVELHLTWGTLHALRKIGLLEEGASEPEQVARALTGYLGATTAALADMSRRFQALRTSRAGP